MSRQSDCDIDSDKTRVGKIKNFDTLAERLAKYASLTDAKISDRHKTIFLANDEDESSDEDLDLSDEAEETQDRSELGPAAATEPIPPPPRGGCLSRLPAAA